MTGNIVEDFVCNDGTVFALNGDKVIITYKNNDRASIEFNNMRKSFRQLRMLKE